MTRRLTTRRAGFTLVEIMVAMTILVIALGGFAGLTFQYIRRVQSSSGQVAKTAAINEQVQRLTTLTFDSLASRAGCVTVGNGPMPHRRCVTIATVGNNKHKRITVIITPTNPAIRPDTAIFDRTNPPITDPMNTTP